MERVYPALRGRIVEKLGSQSVLAEAIGLSEHTLSLKLNGKADWKLREVKAIARALDIAPNDIAVYFF